MTTVRQILNQKGQEMFSVGPEATVSEALKKMEELNVGALLIVFEGEPLGIFTERDFARKINLENPSAKDTQVSELMTQEAFCVNVDASLEQCMEIMIYKHIRHLPVTENDKMVGFITIRDLVQSIVSDKESTINHLKDYISGEAYGARL